MILSIPTLGIIKLEATSITRPDVSYSLNGKFGFVIPQGLVRLLDHLSIQISQFLLNQNGKRKQEIRWIDARQGVTHTPNASDLVCPQGHGALLPGDNFCQQCGARGVMPASNLCLHCYAPLLTGAHFCIVCGKPVATPSLLIALCPQCRQPVSTTIHFCTNCGYDLRQSQTRPTPPPVISSSSPTIITSTTESWLNEEPTTLPPEPPQGEDSALPTFEPSSSTELTGGNPTAPGSIEFPLSGTTETNQSLELPNHIACPSCGHMVAANVHFCAECGHQLRMEPEEETTENESTLLTCPVCHSVVASGTVFCTGCGHYLSAVTGDLGENR